MSPRVSMIEVYTLQISVSDCTEAELDAANWRYDKNTPCGRDRTRLFDDLDELCQEMKEWMPKIPKKAIFMIDKDIMTEREWEALPQIEDDADPAPEREP